MANDLFLYWGSGSAPCWRVMLALEEKGLSGYPNKLISFDKNEHKSDEILKWNPRGQVPTFVHNGHAVNESMAACEYIEKVFADQGTKLFPDDAAQLALVLQKTFEAINFETAGRRCIKYLYHTKPENVDKEALKQKVAKFFDELAIWETHLSKKAESGGSAGYLAGQFSLADVIFFPHLAYDVRFGLELEPKYPNLAKYYKLMLERPSVQKSWPPHWKEQAVPFKAFVSP